jgi:hypothetical protein
VNVCDAEEEPASLATSLEDLGLPHELALFASDLLLLLIVVGGVLVVSVACSHPWHAWSRQHSGGSTRMV